MIVQVNISEIVNTYYETLSKFSGISKSALMANALVNDVIKRCDAGPIPELISKEEENA